MGYVSQKGKRIKRNKFLVRKANLSLLNTKQIKKLTRLKYLTFKYDTYTGILSNDIIYKSISENDKKLIFFDTIISYDLDENNNIIKPFYNIYIPTLFLDYIRFAYKNSLLSNPDKINIDDLPKLEREIYLIFSTQNKDYQYEDYKVIKEQFELDNNSNYKARIKALHEYTMNRNSIPGFYFFLAVMYDIIPVKYMGKTTVSTNMEFEYDNIFFREPEEKR